MYLMTSLPLLCCLFSELLFACPWTDLEGQVINISGLKARAQGRIQRVALKLGHGKSESDDSKVLTHTHNLPAVQLLFSVFLQRSDQSITAYGFFRFFICLQCTFLLPSTVGSIKFLFFFPLFSALEGGPPLDGLF